jgi:hypothetical protein
VPGVTPARIGELTDRDVGRPLAIVGYGYFDDTLQSGRRRAGTVHLRAREGRIFELMFGSYEAFRAWIDSEGGANASARRLVTESEIRSALGLPELADGEAPVEAPADDAPVAEEDPYEAYYREIYETYRMIPGYEVYVGNTEGDAQACRGDSGGPLLRFVRGELRVYAVGSGVQRTATEECALGAFYAALHEETMTAVQSAKSWRDPCRDVTEAGECRGDRAVRCTGREEGPRRITRTDCSLLGQTCGVGDDGQVACVDEPVAPGCDDDLEI